MIEHNYVAHEREGWSVCTRCGMVRNYDRPIAGCRGVTGNIAVRGGMTMTVVEEETSTPHDNTRRSYTATLITRGVHLLAAVHEGDRCLGVITVRRFSRDVPPASWADAALLHHLATVPDLDVAIVALARAVTDAVRRRFWGANL